MRSEFWGQILVRYLGQVVDEDVEEILVVLGCILAKRICVSSREKTLLSKCLTPEKCEDSQLTFQLAWTMSPTLTLPTTVK